MSKVHAILYPSLAGALLLMGWLWQESKPKTADTAQVVSMAKTIQASTDARAAEVIAQTEATLATQNKALATKRTSAKTEQQQVVLINELDNTQLEIPQELNPSQQSEIPVNVSASDISTLADTSVNLKEAGNQIAADEIVISQQKSEIQSRDTVITAQYKEITVLKGGSRLKRFFKATEHVAVGAVIGVGVGVVIDRKFK